MVYKHELHKYHVWDELPEKDKVMLVLQVVKILEMTSQATMFGMSGI